jgi:L-asparagine transporter-like permease
MSLLRFIWNKINVGFRIKIIIIRHHQSKFFFLVILTFVNCWDVKWATSVQDIFTFAKLAALFIIIIMGGYLLAQGKSFPFHFY